MAQPHSWTEAPDGWRSGRHRIQLIAPGLWALVEEDSDDDPHVTIPVIITTSASLNALKHIAERRERRRWKRRRMWKHTAAAMTAVVGVALTSVLPPGWMVLAVFISMLVAIRSLAIVADTVTDASWARVSQTYQ